MAKQSGKTVIRGNSGSVWVDGQELAQATEFTLVMSLNRSDVNFANQPAGESKLTGWTGSGTIVINQTNNYVGQKFVSQLAKGIDVRFDLFGKLDDPDTAGAIRVSVTDCWLTGDIPVFGYSGTDPLTQTLNIGFSSEPVYS